MERVQDYLRCYVTYATEIDLDKKLNKFFAPIIKQNLKKFNDVFWVRTYKNVHSLATYFIPY